YTLRYPSCAWVEIIGLNEHYEHALVDAEQMETGFTVKTTNVQALHLSLPANPPVPCLVNIDGQALTTRPWLNRAGAYHLYLERRDGNWTTVLPQKLLTERVRRPHKVSGLQGPIDDAFMDGFLCVRGTGEPWHQAIQKYAEDSLKRFQDEWSKYLRGDLPVKDDQDITE